MNDLAILLSLTEEPIMADPENSTDEAEPEVTEETEPEPEPEPEPESKPSGFAEPEYNEDIPPEALKLYQTAMQFCERMSRGQKHLAMKESYPNLQVALRDARHLFIKN